VIQAVIMAVLVPLAAYVGATRFPEHWGLLILAGAAAAIVVVELSLRSETRKAAAAVTPRQAEFGFDSRQTWILTAMMLAAVAVLFWTLFARDGVHQLRPLHAHAMVYVTGMLLGVTLWLPFHARKWASK
jgi:hypothetical protein